MKTQIEDLEDLDESFKKLFEDIFTMGGYYHEARKIVNEVLLFYSNFESVVFDLSPNIDFSKQQFEDANIIVNRIFPMLEKIEMAYSFELLFNKSVGHEMKDASNWPELYRNELHGVQSDLIALAKTIGSAKLVELRNRFIDYFVFYLIHRDNSLPEINPEHKEFRGVVFDFMKDIFDRLIEMSGGKCKSTLRKSA